jgi:FkbM family methyltransferase
MGKSRPSQLLIASFVVAAVAWGATACEDARRDILGTEKTLYSQHDEELIIRDFFQDRRGGFFLDVGCAWPIRHSTTYYLEKHLGWSGIGIDALPDYGPGWKEQRPRSRFFQFIVTDHSGSIETFYRAGWPGVSSTEKGRVLGGRKVRQHEMRVRTTTLNDLLEREGVESIDLLSMDIEGSEPKALSGFDIERYHPELVCIEAMPANREYFVEYFSSHGYQRIELSMDREIANWYFRPVTGGPGPDRDAL